MRKETLLTKIISLIKATTTSRIQILLFDKILMISISRVTKIVTWVIEMIVILINHTRISMYQCT